MRRGSTSQLASALKMHAHRQSQGGALYYTELKGSAKKNTV
jgi:hypothetical protein